MNLKLFKLIGRVIQNIFRFYWRMILIIAVVLWCVMSYISSVTAWKAVFLDNTQVYFGHYFHIPFTRFATLRDAYFIRSAQEAGTSTNALLVPLESEPHGPKGFMKINVDHIVGVHILRSDSPLVQTIEQEILETQ